MRKIMVWGVLLFSTLLFIQACSSKKPPRSTPPVPVTIAFAVQKTVPIQIEAIGSVEAFQSISVRSQVTAQIKKVLFKEGQDVKKGSLLIELDSGTNDATLKQAEANLIKDKAQAKYAQEQARRYADLVKKDYIAKEQYEQIQANSASLDATIRADEAIVENNRIQVQFCSIYAPLDGRIGKLLVDQGNIAKANDMELFTINQIQPVNVVFAITDKDLPRVKKYFMEKKLSVDAFIDGDERPEKGELSFVDNAIDKTTGTITLKGTFANKDKRLWPGLFVNVVLTLATQPDAILVPTQSVDQSQQGQYVFVIGPDSKAEMKPVEVGQAISGETVILKGIKAGDRVVTDGQMRLTPDAKVSIKNTK